MELSGAQRDRNMGEGAVCAEFAGIYDILYLAYTKLLGLTTAGQLIWI